MIVNVLLGLLAAAIFYLVATALVVFPHSALLFGLIALVIFFAVAFGGGVTLWRR